MAKSGGKRMSDGILNEAFYEALTVLFLSLTVAVGVGLFVESVRENYFIVVIVPLCLFLAEFIGRIVYDAYLR
jgi:hypothetical protein